MLDRIKQWLTLFGVYKVMADGVNFLNLAENPNGTSYNQYIICHFDTMRIHGILAVSTHTRILTCN